MSERHTHPSRDPRVIRKMADLLRSGAAMLAEHCPRCGLPLFRLKSGEIICPVHGRVYVVKTEAEVTRATVEGVLEQLERLLVEKIGSSLEALRQAEFTDDEKPRALIMWLEALERVERILQSIRGQLRRGEGKEEDKREKRG
ncbi:Sjogrens syndrome scleroderma autoantigen 1 [Pyrolobus fumarii 1A]|uniref:Sjogrens syndrome scleroderma autoantigen 1 n=1 Tax=Pyrolobus fumarii (strain DSM 11204 / 1A) TaxID=694429 RepID=G0EE62_PYRF1|nr:Sjogren's syndrome/scleroderma autoantigen 1 family protein [Pyrolobus fumarii]AEM38756.1 Sjogrens syndrome scleroderma autoantigen 1 [Pyrolobus fumarii 1A]